MKKVLFLMLLFLSGAAVSIKAQVTIGEKKIPESYSALEIISNGSNGLRLPQLTTTQRDEIAASGKMLAEGLMIFNTETKCVDYWNGSKWMNLCAGSLDEDLSGNYKLSGKTCFDVKQINNDAGCGALSSRPNDFASTKSFTYTFSCSTGLTYSNLNFWISDENGLIATTNTANNVFTVTFKDNIASLAAGTDKTTAKKLIIVAQYKDNNNAEKQVSLVVSVQDCACGCSVKSGANSWLTFMCHNLGANGTMSIDEQMAYTPKPIPSALESTDSTVYGNIYQWGRQADGHEKRNSSTIDNSSVTYDATTGQATGTAVGKFITGHEWRATPDNTPWKDGVKTGNDPCPTGWRVPTSGEWKSIFNNNDSPFYIDDSWSATLGSGNKVRWRTTGTNTKGLEISTDGNTTALFLPAAGVRNYNDGSQYSAGTNGGYWSSTTDPYTYPYSLTFYNIYISPIDNYFSTYGFSVRCVAE